MEKKSGQVGREGVTDAERARLSVASLGSDTDRVDFDTDRVDPSLCIKTRPVLDVTPGVV
jgi:hypothetical protein